MFECGPAAFQVPRRWARCKMVAEFTTVAVAAIKCGARLTAARDRQTRAAAEESVRTPSFDSGVLAYRNRAKKSVCL